MSKNYKKNAPETKVIETDRYELPQLLISLTEEKVNKKGTDEQLERRHQIIELMSGKLVDLTKLTDLLNAAPGTYEPMFQNAKPFFKLMYKLNGWNHLNPNDFIKPPCVSLWIKKYVYARFGSDVLPSLLGRENPILFGYVRRYKLFQYFNESGRILLEEVIDQMIEVMKVSKDWYDFELRYTKLYRLPVQLKLFRD